VKIKTPKYIIQHANEQPSFVRRYWFVMLLIAIAIATYFLGRFINLDILNAFQGTQTSLKTENQRLFEKNQQLKASESLLKTDVTVKQQALLEMQQAYEVLIKKNDILKSDVDFYQNLLANKGGDKTLRVFDIEVYTDVSQTLYTLKVVLAQKLEKAQILKGSIKMTLFGIQSDNTTSIDLTKQFKLDESFEFKYYQINKYTISLPTGFNPTELLVELHSRNNRPKNISQRFHWQDILKVTGTI